jgi:hypothetical protein
MLTLVSPRCSPKRQRRMFSIAITFITSIPRCSTSLRRMQRDEQAQARCNTNKDSHHAFRQGEDGQFDWIDSSGVIIDHAEADGTS